MRPVLSEVARGIQAHVTKLIVVIRPALSDIDPTTHYGSLPARGTGSTQLPVRAGGYILTLLYPHGGRLHLERLMQSLGLH